MLKLWDLCLSIYLELCIQLTPQPYATQRNLMTRSIWVRLPYLDSPFRLADRCRRRRAIFFFFLLKSIYSIYRRKFLLEIINESVRSVCGNVHIVNNGERKKSTEILKFSLFLSLSALVRPLGWALRIFIGARQSFSVTFVAFLRHRHNHWSQNIKKKKKREKVYDNFILATRTIRSSRLHSSGTLDSILIKRIHTVRTHKIKDNERIEMNSKSRYSHASQRHICAIVYLAGRYNSIDFYCNEKITESL